MAAGKKSPEDAKEITLTVEEVAAMRASVEGAPSVPQMGTPILGGPPAVTDPGRNIGEIGDIVAKAEEAEATAAVPASPNGNDPHSASGKAQPAPTPATGGIEVSLAQAKPTGASWKSKFGKRRFPWIEGEQPPSPAWQITDEKASAGGGGDASAKQGGANPSNPNNPQRADNPGAGGNNPPPPPRNPWRGFGGHEPPEEGGRQMRGRIAGWAVAAVALPFLVFWWPGPRIAHWWATPTGQPVATAPANKEADEERRLNEGLRAQIADLQQQNAKLRKELRDIADDRAKTLAAFIEKAKATVAARAMLAAAPCDCRKKVAASKPKAQHPPRPAPVDTRPPMREQQPAQQQPAPAPVVASAIPAPGVMASTDTEPQQFVILVHKGSIRGPLVTEPIHFNVRFLDPNRRIVRKFGVEVLGASQTLLFDRQPGTAFQVIGPANLAFLQPAAGTMLEGKASETDPTRVANIRFVVP